MEARKVELAAALLRSTGRLRLKVDGSSMLPAVRPRDLLLIRRCHVASAAIGDIVLFTRDRRLVAHRVVSRTQDGLVTQGDAVPQPDPPIGEAELLGRVHRLVRRGRTLRPTSRPTWSERLAAALFRRSGSAGRAFLRLNGLQRRLGI